ncbi:unnamed protein product [Auanema sp. JU1783]|nr:unnamed protein product [Auanema sp. JU1783]
MKSILIFACILTLCSASLISCPNGQQPEKDDTGKLIQCLPGLSVSQCGKAYGCFFSGVNYLCCPNNEIANRTNVCPATYTTVMSSQGAPVKCNLYQSCPLRKMECVHTGRDYTCCEPYLLTKKSKQSLTECPKGTKNVINEQGKKVMCLRETQCVNENQFCFGRRKVCCERIPQEKPRKSIFHKSNNLSGWIGFRAT